MDMMKAIEARHSVRSYTARPLEAAAVKALRDRIGELNAASGLNLQLVTDEPKAFGGRLAHYGKFEGVRNYIACVGPKGPQLDEAVGYNGEELVLLAQTLGLNTCWVGLTYSKGRCACTVRPGEKIAAVISLGYGTTQGLTHKVKAADQVSRYDQKAPAWFTKGVQAALLAPTAMNQQHFMLELEGQKVKARSTGGFYSKMDLGIVKRHFEIASGKGPEVWA